MGLNDSAWETLFEKYRILDEIEHKGKFIITASQIKEFREPRLMTKFDHAVNLPALFADHHLSILPISGNSYVISHFKAYHQFDDVAAGMKRVSLPGYIQSMQDNVVSESIALNCAIAAGIIADFLEDDGLLATVSGKMGSGIFDFQIENISGGVPFQFKVNNARIEIDAAYEGVKYLSLFEAKRDLSEDFLVRQLYYPYRTWSSRVTKRVKPVFLIYSNGIFHLYEYRFEDVLNYNSLTLVKQKNYAISADISLREIENILNEVPLVEEPDISFPQANSMARLINLVELLYEKPMTKQEITAEYAFDERQTNYYADAGRYLELIEKGQDDKHNVIFRLSPKGYLLMGLNYKERQLAIATQILKHKVFHETLKICLRCGDMPDSAKIVEIMKRSNLFQVEAESTYARRASTITGWIRWILSLIEAA